MVFAYYDCPMLCTLVLNGLLRCLRAIPLDAGRDFTVLVVSFAVVLTNLIADIASRILDPRIRGGTGLKPRPLPELTRGRAPAPQAQVTETG